MKTLVLILCLAFSTSIFAQNDANLEIKLFSSYQQNDQRFFGSGQEADDWGTTQFGFSINKSVVAWNQFEIQLGTGLSRETNTYLTPYDHCFDNPGGPCNEVLKWIDRYTIDLVQTPITLKYKLLQNLRLDFGIVPQLYFHKRVKGGGETSDFVAGLYSIEFNPGVVYAPGRLNFNLGFRLFQLKTIDKVYLYGNRFLSKKPGYLDQTFDTYNPIKVLLSIGYDINGN